MASVDAIRETVRDAILLDQDQRRRVAKDTREIITSLERLADLRLDAQISTSEFEVCFENITAKLAFSICSNSPKKPIPFLTQNAIRCLIMSRQSKPN